MAPRADKTEKSPKRRIAHAPKEMGDQLLNMMAGKFADWNSMCQKRKGRPRSIVSNSPLRIAPTAATRYPVRMTGRASRPPNHSTDAATKETPPTRPPAQTQGNQYQ